VISRQFVRLMGSDIEVRSRRGEGNMFAFELEVPASEWTSRADLEPEAGTIGFDGLRRCVLVVDDVRENRAVLVSALEGAGFEVHEAATGGEGLAKAQSLQPDLILMDIVLPDVGGIEVIQRLRRLPLFESTPIIAVSASASPEVEVQAIAAGANAFLAKPLQLKALMLRMANLLRLSAVDAGMSDKQGASGRAVA
jgi:CheY-like chemotaxis protein